MWEFRCLQSALKRATDSEWAIEEFHKINPKLVAIPGVSLSEGQFPTKRQSSRGLRENVWKMGGEISS